MLLKCQPYELDRCSHCEPARSYFHLQTMKLRRGAGEASLRAHGFAYSLARNSVLLERSAGSGTWMDTQRVIGQL